LLLDTSTLLPSQRQNLLALHAVESAHQEDISVEDIYEVAESLASLPALHTQKLKRQSQQPIVEAKEDTADLKWPSTDEDFFGGTGRGRMENLFSCVI